MIYFVTNKSKEYSKSIDTNLFSNLTILEGEEGLNLYYRKLHGKKKVYLDIEASSLDAYDAKLILTGVRIKSSYFIFDYTIDPYQIVEPLTSKYVIGHNLKYDIKILKVQSSILIKNLYDTMIAEQKLFAGAGYKYGYDEVVGRYTNNAVFKTVRNEFINADPETFNITYAHLHYLKTDLQYLPKIMEKQKLRIKRQKQEFLIYGIENPLVAVIANAELRGFQLNRDKWIARVEKDITKKHEILCNLDTIVRHLRDVIPDARRELLVGGKWDKVRKRNSLVDLVNTKGQTEILDLFGEPTSAITLFGRSTKPTSSIPKIEEYPGSVKYTKQEVIHIFGALNQMAITDLETFSIPKFDKNGKLEDFNKYSIKANILERYLIMKPNSIMKDFLKQFEELQKVNKMLSTYGKSFIDKIHPATGHIHSSFGQSFADTGRMTSGGGKNEPDKYNAQNLPRSKELRNAFEAREGYSINTADYSGAELVIMASHAQDFKLLELSKGDMHSHFATKGWRAIYAIRASELKPFIANDEAYLLKYGEAIKNASTFTVTKDNPPGYRQAYKPVAFGVVYGAYPKKIAQVLNISANEGKGVVASVEKEIPKTIQMVKDKSLFAEKYGYVIHNKRTNSRRWFPALIKKIKGDYSNDTHFKEISEDLSAARNTTIQGTQADFVKEASVKLQYWYWKNGYDANILSWVHDEIVDEMPNEHVGYLSFIKHEILTTVANKYLENVTIDVEQIVLPYWTK